MRKVAILIICIFFLFINIFDAFSGGLVWVRGYFRKDGTYVRPHFRTAPDGIPYNNFSFPGNYNPNTGKITPGNPSTYLERYYNRKSSTYIPHIYIPSVPLYINEGTNLKNTSFGTLSSNLNISEVYNDNTDLQKLFGNKNTLDIKLQEPTSLNDLF
jgi:hypothetical protein